MGLPQNYDSYARQYAITRSAVEWILNPLIEEVKKLEKGNSVVEIGCGTGNYIIKLSEHFEDYSFSGFDVSANMLDVAGSRCGSIKFIHSDAESNFPYDSSSCSLAFAVDVIHHIVDLNNFFAESSRILKNNSPLIIVTDDEQTMKQRSLTKFFPEILQIELDRYPGIGELNQFASDNNFICVNDVIVRGESKIDEDMISKYEQKCSSAMRLMKDEDHSKGIIRLKQASKRGEYWQSIYRILKFRKQ